MFSVPLERHDETRYAYALPAQALDHRRRVPDLADLVHDLHRAQIVVVQPVQVGIVEETLEQILGQPVRRNEVVPGQFAKTVGRRPGCRRIEAFADLERLRFGIIAGQYRCGEKGRDRDPYDGSKLHHQIRIVMPSARE